MWTDIAKGLDPPCELRANVDPTIADDLALLDWTGRRRVPGRRGTRAERVPAIVLGIGLDAERWTTRVAGFGSGCARAVGSVQDLMTLAERLAQRWRKEIGLALRLG